MKNSEIYDLYEGLVLLGRDKDLKFNAKISFYLAKNKNILEPLYNAIVDTRFQVLEKYGERQENGDYKVSVENMEEFTKEWDSFMNIDNIVTLNNINIDDFKDEKINIDLVEKLMPILKE